MKTGEEKINSGGNSDTKKFWLRFNVAINRNKSPRQLISVVSLVSLGILGGYYLYNSYLNETYHGGVFINKPLPFESWDDFMTAINYSFKYVWIGEYMLLAQYLLLPVIIACAVPFMRRLSAWPLKRVLLWLFVLGALSMAGLLGHNFHVHDYYIIATFLPLIAYLLVISVTALSGLTKESPDGRKAFTIAAFTAVLIMFFFADHHTFRRLIKGDMPEFVDFGPSKWLENGAKTLDALHIPKTEPILVLDEAPPNLSLIYFDRKGYNFTPGTWGDDKGLVEGFMKDRKVKLAIIKEENANRLLERDSLFFNHFTQLHKGDGKAVYLLKQN